jgi:tripartite-type tricarboxylate transporter receptor subunit TctC
MLCGPRIRFKFIRFLPSLIEELKMAFAKILLLCLVSSLSALVGSTAGAQGYPSKPIVLVVPFAPGGFVHTVAQIYAESIGNALGQSVVVLNKPGANGNIAAEFVAKSAPDGYTLFLPTASILTINPHLYKNLQFDALKDFAPVGLIANTSNVFVVSPRSGIKTLKDLVDKARANPGAVSYGSSGPGSIQHIAGESLKRQANVDLIHVPYKGVGPALIDVIGDRLTVMFSDASGIPQVKDGKLTAIAVSPRRIDELPGVPTVAESAAAAGIPGYAPPAIWYGIVAPNGTPKDIVARINAAMAQTLKKPEVRDRLLAAGASPAENPSSEYFGGVIQADHARYANLLKTLNITVD